MPYCQHCGNEVDHLPETGTATEAVSAEIQVAKINAEKEIELAKINARMDRNWNETRVEVAEVEAEAEVAAAEATAEVIGEVLAAETETVTEEEPPAEPIIVTAEPDDGGEDIAPPETGPPAEPKQKASWSFA
jgi:hypothetical protein